MQAQVLQQTLTKALSLTSRFVSTRAQLPVLANIYLSAQKAHLTLKATNLETAVSTQIGAKITTPGEISLPAQNFTSLVTNLSPGQVDLKVDKENLTLEASGTTATLAAVNAADFPSVPDQLSSKALKIKSEPFLAALDQVLFACSTDETKPVLNGVLFLFKPSELILVATDGFRLSQSSLPLKSSQKGSLVIPRAILSEVVKIASKTEELSLEVNTKDNQVVFGLDGHVLSSRVLEGKYPNYEAIIPKTSKTKVNADRDEFSRALALAAVYAKDSANTVKLSVGKGSLEVSATSGSGTQKTSLDAKVEGPVLEISYNYHFLTDFLNSRVGESVDLAFIDQASPGVFTSPNEKNFLHLIMPVKVGE